MIRLCFKSDNGDYIPYPIEITEHFHSKPYLPYTYGNYIIKYHNGEIIQVKKDKCNETCPKCSIYTNDNDRHKREVIFAIVNIINPNQNKNLDNNQGNTNCSICMSTYENKHASNCGHVACYECWNHWLNEISNHQKTCFTCRQSVYTLIKLFE